MQQVLQLRILLLHCSQPAPQLLSQLCQQRLSLQGLSQSVAPSLLPCMGRLTGQGRDWLRNGTTVLLDLNMAPSLQPCSSTVWLSASASRTQSCLQ